MIDRRGMIFRGRQMRAPRSIDNAFGSDNAFNKHKTQTAVSATAMQLAGDPDNAAAAFLRDEGKTRKKCFFLA